MLLGLPFSDDSGSLVLFFGVLFLLLFKFSNANPPDVYRFEFRYLNSIKGVGDINLSL